MYCIRCGEEFSYKRYELGYRTCLTCGEKSARAQTHCIVPLHKGAYQPITDMSLLKGINTKYSS